MAEVDIAYQILSAAGQPIYFKDLIMEIIDKKQKPVQSLSLAISEVYTLINSRFHHVGKGMWGLAELTPQEVKRSSSSSSSTKSNTKRREKLLEEIQDLDPVSKKRDEE